MCLLLAKGRKKNQWRKKKRKRRKSNHKLNRRDCLQQTSRYHVYPWIICTHPVILLQIVVMNPGTHLVKNHESQSKKQPHSLKTDSKTLCYSLLKEKYTPSIVKHNKDLNRCCLTTATRTATEITQTGYSPKKHL